MDFPLGHLEELIYPRGHELIRIQTHASHGPGEKKGPQLVEIEAAFPWTLLELSQDEKNIKQERTLPLSDGFIQWENRKWP